MGGVLLRLIPHLPNFTPISATAIFGGAYLKKKYAILLPLLALAISDYLLLYINPFQTPMVNFSRIYPIWAMFHPTTLYVWGSFVISGLIGLFIRGKKKTRYIVGASLLASIQFFLITNFGVWMGGYYGMTFKGLINCYIEGLPFFQRTILGDLFYTISFFVLFELVWKISFKTKAYLGVKN